MTQQKIKIFQVGAKLLRQKAKEVPLEKIKTAKFQKIIERMKNVILENEEALAVAAPQIGESWRITVISEWALQPDLKKPKNDFKNMVFVNPKILKKAKNRKLFPEGCLSTPNIYGSVERAEKVKIDAYDENGKKFSRGASGLFAQAIQHEIDHLNGVLFIDKALYLSKIQDH